MIRPLITINRLEDNFEFGTFGVLLIQTEIFCVTLEPCEYENQKNISCIPAGCYEMEQFTSPKFGPTYQIVNVPGRDLILVHKGNEVDETEGCIIIAEKFGKLGPGRAVLNSGNTFEMFMGAMAPYHKLDLIIKETWA